MTFLSKKLAGKENWSAEKKPSITGIDGIPKGAQVMYIVEGEEPTTGIFKGVDPKYPFLLIDDEMISYHHLICIKVVE